MAEQQPIRPVESSSIRHWCTPGDDPKTIVEGDGSYVYDDEGAQYLDFVSSLYCANAGHSHPDVVERVRDQLDRIQYVSPKSHNDTRSALADRIADVAPDSLTSVFFSISGSEANEAAIQFARKYQDAPKVLTRWQSYHGSTYGSAAMTGEPDTRNTIQEHAATTGYGKFLPPLPEAFGTDDPEELARRAADHLEFVIRNEGPESVAAVLTEPVAGSSGAYTAPPGYFERVREICDRHDVLLISDEVIAGFGRCGDWFGIQTEGVEPDLLTFAKGVTSAYVPLAGVIARPEIAAHFREEGLDMGQTFAGHPMGCAAGMGAMDAYENGLLENVRDLEPYLGDRLRELESSDAVDEVRGRGFQWAVTFADPETGELFHDPWVDEGDDNPVSDVHDAVSDHDVMIGMGRPGFQLVCSPPFTVGKAEIDRAVDAIADGIETVFE